MPLQIIRQDITTMQADAIVNTTNEKMVGYSGADRQVHQKAGPALDALCRQLTPLELGFAKVTPGFGLQCKYIIHTSGPVWRGGRQGERAILKSCYLESLKLAREQGCQSIAFPLISSGNYGYPKDQVLKYAVQVISEFLQDNEMDVYLCVWDKDSYEFSRSLYADISRFIDSRMEKRRPCMAAAPKAAKPRKIHLPTITRRETTEETIKETVNYGAAAPLVEPMPCTSPCPYSLAEYLHTMDEGFADTLFRLIDEKGMTDVECYKRANVDRRTFSKIKSNPEYRPSKQTALAFSIALKLNLNETKHLLETAGLALSHSAKFDMIIEYFITHGIYDIYIINQALFEFDQMLLGS